jgi:hypothetical protein
VCFGEVMSRFAEKTKLRAKRKNVQISVHPAHKFQEKSAMLTQCRDLLDCLSFLLVCFFYGYSLVFLDRRYRWWCSIGLALLLGILYLMDIGAEPWWSALAVLLGFALTRSMAPISGFLLPIRITAYTPINVALFFVPFIPVVISAGQANNASSAAMLLFTSAVIAVPWTVFTLIELLVHRSPAMLGVTHPQEHEHWHSHDQSFLRVTWKLAGASLVISTIIVIIRWIIVR